MPPSLPVLPPPIALLEIAVLIVPLTLINFYTSVLPPLAELQPHPFWLAVLLLSLQYGTPSGLIAAAVAILATLILGLPVQEVGENHFNYTLRIWAQPALWIAAAVILGQFRLRQIEAKSELRRTVGELTGQRNAIADYSTNLRARCDALERHVATQHTPVLGDDVDALVGLTGARGSEIPAALGAALEATVGACKGSLFANSGDGLSLLAAVEWSSSSSWKSRIGIGEGIYRAIVVEGRPLSVLTAGDEIDLKGEGVLAVPVLAATGDRVIGMIKVEEIEPTRLDERAQPRLELLAALLAPALEASASMRLRTLSAPSVVMKRPPPRQRLWRRLRRQPQSEPLVREVVREVGHDAPQAGRAGKGHE